jgi:hypothetical protein
MGWMKLTATLGTWVIAVLGLVWAIVSYRLNNRSSLALERTKFIFEHLKYFDIQPSMQTANKIVYGLIPDFTIETFLDVMKSGKGTPDQISNCMAIENYLNFLWRIGYAHFTLKTISVDDLDAFGYYFYTVSEHTALSDYCIEEGFEEIIQVALKLKPIWDESDRENISLRAEYEKVFTVSSAVSNSGAPSGSAP